MEKACQLMGTLKSLEPCDIMALMSVSDKIAQTNAARFQTWVWDNTQPFSLNPPQKHACQTPAKPAIYLFNGEVYTGLDAYHLDTTAISYLQQHLGILSGLYGLLKPLDLILPYRLEMGTKLSTPYANNLYEFWGDSITQVINERLAETKNAGIIENCDHVLINLASQEYFKAINPKKITADIITPRFEEEKNGDYKVVSFYAKKARGLMVKFACENNLHRVEQLKDFNLAGYRFMPHASSSTDYVFRR